MKNTVIETKDKKLEITITYKTDIIQSFIQGFILVVLVVVLCEIFIERMKISDFIHKEKQNDPEQIQEELNEDRIVLMNKTINTFSEV